MGEDLESRPLKAWRKGQPMVEATEAEDERDDRRRWLVGMMEGEVVGMVQGEVMVDDAMEAVEIMEAIWVCVHVYTWVCTPVRACPQHAWLCAHVTSGHHPGVTPAWQRLSSQAAA